MNSTYYFSHDYNTRSDIKIKRLIAKTGMTGYGIFWSIIEDLYNNANALPTDYESIAFELRTDESIVKTIVESFDLFQIKKGTFSSKSVQRRLDQRKSKSEKARESAMKRWGEKKDLDANAFRSDSNGNAIKERKSNKRKLKGKDDIAPYPELSENEFPKVDSEDSIEYQKTSPKTGREKSAPNSLPTESEVIKYFVDNGYTEESAIEAFKYYNDDMIDRGGRVWKDSHGNTVRSWKQKMRGVWFKDENKKNLKTGLSDEMSEKLTKACKWVTDYLNKNLGTNYSPTEKHTMEAILNRLKEGRTSKEFKEVLDKKIKEWKGTKMQKNLQPYILFGDYFSRYLEQPDPDSPNGDSKSVTLKIGEYNR